MLVSSFLAATFYINEHGFANRRLITPRSTGDKEPTARSGNDGLRILSRLQVESSRQMYRSTMEQVAHFLGRAHRSLEILHIKENIKDKRRVPRSRSVHTVMHADPSPSLGATSPSSTSSMSSSSPFTRAKSVTQIGSPSATCFREFTWSVLRRNDPVHCTSPRAKPPQDRGKAGDLANDNVVYREPKQPEVNPDEIPPEKLSQEAFRYAERSLRQSFKHLPFRVFNYH